MPWFSYFAIFFVIWWLTLFAILPFGVRRDEPDAASRAEGTDHGAPSHIHATRIVVMTTAVAAIVFACYYIVTVIFGLGFDDVPVFLPAAA